MSGRGQLDRTKNKREPRSPPPAPMEAPTLSWGCSLGLSDCVLAFRNTHTHTHTYIHTQTNKQGIVTVEACPPGPCTRLFSHTTSPSKHRRQHARSFGQHCGSLSRTTAGQERKKNLVSPDPCWGLCSSWSCAFRNKLCFLFGPYVCHSRNSRRGMSLPLTCPRALKVRIS
jgi:hypothetical protein